MENKLVSFGDKAINFTYQTPYGATSTLEEKVQKADKTFLIFLRYYGCTICQLDIRAYRENYQAFWIKMHRSFWFCRALRKLFPRALQRRNSASRWPVTRKVSSMSFTR